MNKIQTEKNILPESVCVVIPRNDLVLVVSRPNDSTQWGMPGGKVEPNESLLDAIVRETEEEVGWKLEKEYLTPLLTTVCKGEITYNTTAFLYSGSWRPLFLLTAENNCQLRYMSWAELLDPKVSPFAEFNSLVFQKWQNC